MYALRLSPMLAAAFMAMLGSVQTASADLIQINYTAKVTTQSGNPFGFSSSILNTSVSGFFTYNTGTVDILPGDPQRGDYPHTAGGAFFVNILGTTISGSATPYIQIENLNPDTFRFIDGVRPVGPTGGVMLLNGIAAPDADLTIAMTDASGAAFGNDSLPTLFPFAQPPLTTSTINFPHTFSLSDNNGTLLLQFDSLSAVPEPSTMMLSLFSLTGIAVFGCLVRFLRARRCLGTEALTSS